MNGDERAQEDVSKALNNPGQEKFCRHLVFGLADADIPEGMEQPRGNLRWAYATAYGQRNTKAADVGAQRLIKLEHIRNRIRLLRSDEEKRERVLVRDWSTMLAKAQLVVEQAMGGKADAVQLKAAMAVIERSEGPTSFRFRADLPATGAPGGFGGKVEVWGMQPIEGAGVKGPAPANRVAPQANGNGKGPHHGNGNGKGA